MAEFRTSLITYKDIRDNNPDWTDAMIEDYLSFKSDMRNVSDDAEDSEDKSSNQIASLISWAGKLKSAIQKSTKKLTDLIQANAYQISNNSNIIASLLSTAGKLKGITSKHTKQVAELYEDVALRETAATGVVSGGTVTQESSTQITIAAGSGEIVNGYTDRRNPTRLNTYWDEITGFVIDMSDNVGLQFVYLDSDSNPQQQSSLLSPTQRRENIQIAMVAYSDGEIVSVNNAPLLSNEVGNTLYDWLYFTPPSNRILGMGVFAVPGDLSFYGGSGKYLAPGINETQSLTNAHIKDFSQIGDDTTPAVFDVILADGSIHSTGNTEPPDQYESPLGTVNNLNGNDAVIHYIYRSLGNNLILQLGQTAYDDSKTARDSLEVDRSIYTYFTNSTATLLSAQSYHRNGAADYDDPNDAGIVSLIGSGSGSSGNVSVNTFLQLTDVTETTYIDKAGMSVNVNDTETGLVFEYPMRFLGAWEQRTYLPNSVVLDNYFTMISNKETDDTAAPKELGLEIVIYNGTSPTNGILAKAVYSGAHLTAGIDSFWVIGYEIYVVTDNTYNVYAINNGVLKELLNFTASSTGWLDFSIQPTLVYSALELSLVSVVTEPAPTPITWTGNWNYTTPNNDTTPANGDAVQSNKNLSQIWISKTDNDGGDREAELLALTQGDAINAAGMHWVIQVISDQGTYVSFTVSPQTQGSPDGVTTFSFETVTATPITIVQDNDYWLTNQPAGSAEIKGLYSLNNSNVVQDDNAYGVNIKYKDAYVSPDWDVMSV